MLNYRLIGVGSTVGGIVLYWAFAPVASLSNPMKGV